MKRFYRRDELSPSMRLCKGKAVKWDVPPIVSTNDLASWLGVDLGQLRWLANIDEHRRQSHYVSRWVRKRSGFRLIESPKPLLKRLQRDILHEILVAVDASDYAHGSVRGRDVHTFVSRHVGQGVCLKLDLKDFFPSITAKRVGAFFKSLGYPKPVTQLLTGLCTNSTDRKTFSHLRTLATDGQTLVPLYARRHLPQGAPTSAALANCIAYRLDCRLAGLARSLAGCYSRYVDDLLFSFPEASLDRQTNNRLRRLANKIAMIIIDEDFDVCFRKTRIMHRSQRQLSVGVVINQKPNIPRQHFDRLKATLHNCVQHGPEAENRDGHNDFRAHLLGRIHWVRRLNFTKGEKLQAIFDRIEWGDPEPRSS